MTNDWLSQNGEKFKTISYRYKVSKSDKPEWSLIRSRCRDNTRAISGGCHALSKTASLTGAYPWDNEYVCEYKNLHVDDEVTVHAVCTGDKYIN